MGKSIYAGLLSFLLMGCQGTADRQALIQSDSIYTASVNHERKQKDDAFAMSPNSPFRDENGDFAGLRYYPVSPGWKIKCQWDKMGMGDTVLMRDTKGQQRIYTKAGTFLFRLKNLDCRIPAYFEDSAKTAFFIMFRDSTNSTETYQGGRYIAFHYSGSDDIVLDFNRAFNPYCHYNHNYACPVIPASHFIPVYIHAGERRYGF
jgi:uncharacterized protein (DUF1684 family)